MKFLKRNINFLLLIILFSFSCSKTEVGKITKEKIRPWQQFTNQTLLERFESFDGLHSNLLERKIKYITKIKQKVNFTPKDNFCFWRDQWNIETELKVTFNIPFDMIVDNQLFSLRYRPLTDERRRRAEKLDFTYSSDLYGWYDTVYDEKKVPVLLSNNLVVFKKLQRWIKEDYNKAIERFIQTEKNWAQLTEYHKQKEATPRTSKWANWSKEYPEKAKDYSLYHFKD